MASVRAVTDVVALVVTKDALERELGRAGWMRSFVEAESRGSPSWTKFEGARDERRGPRLAS